MSDYKNVHPMSGDAGFDPDAFIRENRKSVAGFDPDAFIRENSGRNAGVDNVIKGDEATNWTQGSGVNAARETQGERTEREEQARPERTDNGLLRSIASDFEAGGRQFGNMMSAMELNALASEYETSKREVRKFEGYKKGDALTLEEFAANEGIKIPESYANERERKMAEAALNGAHKRKLEELRHIDPKIWDKRLEYFRGHIADYHKRVPEILASMAEQDRKIAEIS